MNAISNRKRHAVVLGGSMAGLLAARVLSDSFDEVTVVERDELPSHASPRKGVPQARHTHALLARGAEIVERLLPGFGADLDAAGARTLHVGRDVAFLGRFGWSRHFARTIPLRAATRDLIEATVRAHVRRLARVQFREGHEILGLDHRDGRVVGVRLVRRGVPDVRIALRADLVVDAMGRASRMPMWLAELGCGTVAESVVDAGVADASAVYRDVAPLRGGHGGVLVTARGPEVCRGGMVFPIEGGLYVATLTGMRGDAPPTDEAGFLDFARRLRAPDVYDAIVGATRVSPITATRTTANRLRHYERLRRWPRGLVAIGDAVCAFNPVYGQGMTVAAMEAELLGELLRTGRFHGRGFQRAVAKLVAPVWSGATLEDFRYAGTRGEAPLATRLVHRYMDAVFELVPHDAWASERLTRVLQLLEPPTTLFAPAMLRRIVASQLFGRRAAPELPRAAAVEIEPAPASIG